MNMGEKVLVCPMGDWNGAGAKNIREYLVRLAGCAWNEEAAFSGKRPFGYGSWQTEVYSALVKASLVSGSFDDEGCLDECDFETADSLVNEALRVLAHGS